jgi:hypothetical protein
MRDFNVSIRELVETTRYADPATGEPCESVLLPEVDAIDDDDEGKG